MELRNIRVKELLLILAKLNVRYDLVDIVVQEDGSVLVYPVATSAHYVPLTEDEKKLLEEKERKIDPDISLGDLLGNS